MMRILILLAVLVAGCATRTPAPVDDRRPAVPAPPMAPMPMPPPQGSAQAMPVLPVLPPPAPPRDWRPETYTVKRGDTLFAIALEHGLDYRELAAIFARRGPAGPAALLGELAAAMQRLP